MHIHGKDDYGFYLHTNNKVFGPVRTDWDHYLGNDNSYYFKGDDSGPEYILINDSLYRNSGNFSNILLSGRNKFFFSYTNKSSLFINCCGKSMKQNYSDIYYPAMDKNGNYSFFGRRGHYIYYNNSTLTG